MPEISIIIPIYNVEKYLHRCIESILAQTFTNYELILVDDGSPDNCGKICDEYALKDSRIIVIHKENGGVSSARNIGLKHAKGKYIVFCDSDDYIQDDYLDVLYNSMKSEDVDLVCAGYEVVDDTGIPEKCLNGFDLDYCFSDDTSIKDFIIFNVLDRAPNWAIWAKIYRTDIIKPNMIRFCESCENFAEDLAFYLDYILYCKRIKFKKYYGYKYVQRNDSMVHKVEGQIKLNALNEASKDFCRYYNLRFVGNKELLSVYPIIHYLFMDKQYYKIKSNLQQIEIKKEIKKITDQKYYLRNTIKVLFVGKIIKSMFGKNKSFDIKNFSFFCLHHSRKLFSYMDGLFYKLFNKQ